MQSAHIHTVTTQAPSHQLIRSYERRKRGRAPGERREESQERSQEEEQECPDQLSSLLASYDFPHLVSDIMSRTVLTVKPGLPVQKLVGLFKTNQVSGFPVIDDEEKLVGLVSQADVISCVNSKPPRETSFYKAGFQNSSYTTEDIPAELTVNDIMTPFVYYATEDSTIEQVLELMLDNKIHRVVVTRDGKLVGLVSTMDLLKEFYHYLTADDER